MTTELSAVNKILSTWITGRLNLSQSSPKVPYLWKFLRLYHLRESGPCRFKESEIALIRLRSFCYLRYFKVNASTWAGVSKTTLPSSDLSLTVVVSCICESSWTNEQFPALGCGHQSEHLRFAAVTPPHHHVSQVRARAICDGFGASTPPCTYVKRTSNICLVKSISSWYLFSAKLFVQMLTAMTIMARGEYWIW